MIRNYHEDFSEKVETRLGSERGFGVIFAFVFALFGLWPLISGGSIRLWLLAVAAVFLASALVVPRVLRPFNRGWFRFGRLLNKLVSPIFLSLLFFLAVTPTAIILRLSGKELLQLKRTPERDSFWVPRSPPGPSPVSMKKQF